MKRAFICPLCLKPLNSRHPKRCPIGSFVAIGALYAILANPKPMLRLLEAFSAASASVLFARSRKRRKRQLRKMIRAMRRG